MPVTVSHNLSATTPDDPAYEIRPGHWNDTHAFTLNATGSEISNAFGNGGGITFGLSANGAITAAAPAGAPSPVHVSAGTTESDLGTIIFGDSNGLAFGLNGSTITGSYSQSTHSHATPAFSGSNASFTAATVTFGSSNGMHFYTTNGSMVGSYTVPTVTNSSWTVSDNATSGTVARLAFTNLNGVTLSLSSGTGGSHTIVGSHNALTSQSNQNVTASNGGFAFQTLSFSNANGMSFGTSAGSAIFGSYTVPTVPAQFSGGLSNVGNTSGDTGAVTGRLVLAGGNNITLSGSTNAGSMTVTISAGAGGAGDGAVNLGMSTEGNTAGTTGTVSSGRYIFVGTGPISLSQSLNGQSGTLSINGPATSSLVGTSGISVSTNGSTISVQPVPVSQWNKANAGEVSAAGNQHANSQVSIQAFRLDWPIAFSNWRFGASVNVTTTTNNSSAYLDLSISGVVYTRNASTLSSLFSFSNTMTQTWSSNATASVAQTGFLGITATNAATTLTPGDYWVAVHVSTNNTATGGAATTALGNAISMALAESLQSQNVIFRQWGAGTNNSVGMMSGVGIISTGATRASIAFSDYTVTGTRAAAANLYFGLRNETFQA